MDSPKLSGPWSLPEIEQNFAQSIIPMRLSVISRAGWPVVLSLWFLYENGVLKCASRRQSKVISFLKDNPRCGLEIAGETPPYHGIRGQGIATISEDGAAALLERLANRYLGTEDTPFRQWLLAGAHDEAAISVAPVRLMSWDYRNRMKSE
tara:strand:+ start:652 stop:1104 length:453 start_codon:yes stop_codon:yes gene_type:complete